MAQPSAAAPVIQLRNVTKWYNQGAIRTVVLDDASLRVDAGEFVVVLGPSGSGKTTLLNLIGAMDTPSSGTILAGDLDLGKSSHDQRARFRRDSVGFIFQFYNLLPTLTAAENVEAGLDVLDLPRKEIARRIQEYLDAVGLWTWAGSFPAQLSGGQQQRVAVARALAKEPALVLADEPTGNLDRATGGQIVELMRDLNRRTSAAFVVATHNVEIAAIADRVVHIQAGKVVEG